MQKGRVGSKSSQADREEVIFNASQPDGDNQQLRKKDIIKFHHLLSTHLVVSQVLLCPTELSDETITLN